MKKLLIISFLFCSINLIGQSVSFDASTIVREDTILQCYSCGSDRSTYYWRARIVTGADDSLMVTFGGRLNGGHFSPMASDSLPFYITPAKAMNIEYGDTVYETYFTGKNTIATGMYGFKIPEVYIDSIDATGTQTIYFEFYKP